MATCWSSSGQSVRAVKQSEGRWITHKRSHIVVVHIMSQAITFVQVKPHCVGVRVAAEGRPRVTLDLREAGEAIF